jgi:hypothetical protein
MRTEPRIVPQCPEIPFAMLPFYDLFEIQRFNNIINCLSPEQNGVVSMKYLTFVAFILHVGMQGQSISISHNGCRNLRSFNHANAEDKRGITRLDNELWHRDGSLHGNGAVNDHMHSFDSDCGLLSTKCSSTYDCCELSAWGIVVYVFVTLSIVLSIVACSCACCKCCPWHDRMCFANGCCIRDAPTTVAPKRREFTSELPTWDEVATAPVEAIEELPSTKLG